MKRIVTPSQTVGPYYKIGFGPIPALSGPDIPGDRITVTGRLLDGNGDPVPDGMLETWQANHRGKYAHPEDWQDKQVRPGTVPYPGTDAAASGRAQQRPHLVVMVFARGLLKHLITRIYFQDDPKLARDPVLRRVKEEARRATLIAQPEAGQPGAYRWDVRLQGPGETVFFDV
jgi:protocatechuate 3,4-dioxygenase alpha subunit